MRITGTTIFFMSVFVLVAATSIVAASVDEDFLSVEFGKVFQQYFSDQPEGVPDHLSLDQNSHDFLVETFILNHDIDEDIARQEAFNYQLEIVALIAKADEKGIHVSKSETQEYVDKVRNQLETGQSEDGTEVRGHEEQFNHVQGIIKGLGISEEEYWNVLAVHHMKQMLKIDKLRVETIGELTSPEEMKTGYEIWRGKVADHIDEYRSEHYEHIMNFADKVGINDDSELSRGY